MDLDSPSTSTAVKSSSVQFSRRPVKHQIRRRTQRRGDSEGEESGEVSSEDETAVIGRTKRAKVNSFIQSTSSVKARKARVKYSSSSSGDSDCDKKESAAFDVAFESSKTGERSGAGDMGATATFDIETELDKDAQAIFERGMAANKEMKGKEDDKVYRGINSYKTFYDTKDKAAGNAASGLVRKGPIRAPNFLRQTVRWDYQPDLCKDYKETGFCGFGDSCKFMHDRTDYKYGWELEREEKLGTYGKDDDENYEISSDEEELPFKCFICRESFKDPIITKCKHYFCEKCALEYYKSSQRCYICGAQTNGVFNPAKELIAKLKTVASSKEEKEEGEREDEPEGSDQCCNEEH